MEMINKSRSACIVNQFTVDGHLYEIDVFDDEPSDVPHAHIITEDGFECCVLLDAPEYYTHDGYFREIFPNDKTVLRFYEAMLAPLEVFPGKVGFKNSWERAAYCWDKFHDVSVKEREDVPDYRKLWDVSEESQ